MEKGFVIDTYPSENPALYAMVWKIGMQGMTLSPNADAVYNELNTFQRGWLMQPYLETYKGKAMNAFDIASKHFEFLTYRNPSWNNGVPLWIDIDNAPERDDVHKFGVAEVRTYVEYLHTHIKEDMGADYLAFPLLRVNVGTWETWMKNSPVYAKDILAHCNLLLCQPGAVEPAVLSGVGIPTWWEYDWSLVAHDLNKVFAGINVSEIPNSSEDEEPESEEAVEEWPEIEGEPAVEVLWRGPKLGSMRLAVIREND